MSVRAATRKLSGLVWLQSESRFLFLLFVPTVIVYMEAAEVRAGLDAAPQTKPRDGDIPPCWLSEQVSQSCSSA